MTVNTTAKIANCISDTNASRIISNSMMKGKNVVIAVDGCCPDNEERAAKGYRMTEPLKAQLRQNLARLQEYGAVLTTASKLSSKTLQVIGAVDAAPSPAPCAVLNQAKAEPPKAAPVQASAFQSEKKVLGRQDVVQLPEGCVLRVSRGCQITQLAKDIIQVRRIQVIRA